MTNSVMVDTRLKRKIESMNELCGACSIKFKDLIDTFWFDTTDQLQEFLNVQQNERYFDKELRQGYFDYINDANETLRYHIKSNRGTLEVIKEENLGVIKYN